VALSNACAVTGGDSWVLLILSEADGHLVVCMQGADLLETSIFHLEQQFLPTSLHYLKQSNKYIQPQKKMLLFIHLCYFSNSSQLQKYSFKGKFFMDVHFILLMQADFSDSEIPNYMQ
jgi:hypothetical protein